MFGLENQHKGLAVACSQFQLNQYPRRSHSHDKLTQVTDADGTVLNPWKFSSEYHDSETGLVYYNYRDYAPSLGRWISRDTIGENGGINSYGIIGNNILNLLDFWGLWQATAESAGQERRIYIKEDNDTPEKLAKIVELEFSEFDKWAISIVDEDGLCTYSVPNTWISADLLRGGTWDNDLISRCIIRIRS